MESLSDRTEGTEQSHHQEEQAQQSTNTSTKRKADTLDDALNFFRSLKPDTKLTGSVNLHLSLENLKLHAFSDGLTPDQISELMKIIVSSKNKLSQSARSTLVKCLIPSTLVPQEAAVTALLTLAGRVFKNPGPTPLHNLLLRWILLTYDYLEGYESLHKLYNIIFTFLDSSSLMPHACHLLFLLTRKRDVQFYKVQRLNQLIKEVGPEPCIMGLLLIYKVYCPHLVPGSLVYGRKVFFKAHDAAWRNAITTVANQNKEDESRQKTEETQEINCRKAKARPPPTSKRRKLLIPESHTAAAEIEPTEHEPENGIVGAGSASKIPFAQIDTLSQFLESLERIEYPSQIAASLSDPLLQLLISSDLDPIVMARLCFWIQHFFSFGFNESSEEDVERNKSMLSLLFTFSQNVQGLSVVESFLMAYLPTWDGESYAAHIFGLVSSVRPYSFEDLHVMILEPLHRLYFSCDVYFKTMCTSALSKLLQNLAIETSVGLATGQPGNGNNNASTDSEQREPTRKSSNTQLLPRGSTSHSALVDAPVTAQVIFRMIGFLDTMFELGLRMDSDHFLLQFTSLDFLHVVSRLCQKLDVPVVCLPMKVIHRLLLSNCAATLARLCTIINMFRESFAALGDLTIGPSTSVATIVENNSRGVFNGLLLDVMGMLWIGRLFTDRDPKYPSMFSVELPPHVRDIIVENGLTLYRGPAFLGLAYKFLKETQPEGKKVHPGLIKEFKDQYLLFLEREGFPQFRQLVVKNIKAKKK